MPNIVFCAENDAEVCSLVEGRDETTQTNALKCQVGTAPWRRTKEIRESSDKGADLQ